MTTKYVIIGSSAAGVTAARAIRLRDKDGQITMITKDAFSYSRCQLHLVAAGERTTDQARFVTADWAAKQNIILRTGAEVTGLDSDRKVVTLACGDQVPYDKLLISTGSRTFFPPLDGLQGKNTFGLRDIEDAEAVLASLPEVERVCVIGAGLVGCELAAELAGHHGKEVTIVEMAEYPLPLQLESETGQMATELLETHGIKFMGGEMATRVERCKDGNPLGVVLKSGAFVEADLIVCAAGVRANVEFADGSGVKLNRGIVIDKYAATSVEDIYAAGDVTVTEDAVLKRIMPSAIWPTAVRQGKVAAINMTGGEELLTRNTGLKASVALMNEHVISLGPVFDIDPEWEKYTFEGTNSRGKKSLRILFLKDGVLKAAVLWGDVSNAGVYNEAIVNERNVASEFGFIDTLDGAKRGNEKLSIL